MNINLFIKTDKYAEILRKMAEIFDNFLKTNKNSWYIYSHRDKFDEPNGNISWKLQEGHSGPILSVNFDSFFWFIFY